MSLKRGIIAAVFTASLIPAQNAPKQLTARELFYAAAQAPATTPKPATPAKTVPRVPKTAPKPVEIARADPNPSRPTTSGTSAGETAPKTAPMPTTGAPPLGLRYTILKINSDDSTTEVAADTVFHSGDRIRFAIEPNSSGYLYIINQGSSGTWTSMFPSADIDDGNNRVEGFRSYTMPPKSRLAFDTTVGTENLFIVFSRQPEQDLEQTLYQRAGKRAARTTTTPEAPPALDKNMIVAANIGNPMVDRLRNAYSRDLIVEKVNPNTPGDRKETAVYVVNPTGSNDSRVVVDLHLVHQ